MLKQEQKCILFADDTNIFDSDENYNKKSGESWVKIKNMNGYI